MIEGFEWCADAPVEVGLSSLTSKILCTHHNNSLSPLDEAGADAFATLREMTRIRELRKSLSGSFRTICRHSINGSLLERWFLKTLVNLCYHRDFPIGGGDKNGRATEHLVKVVFGLEGFDANEGLYSVSFPGMTTVWEDRLRFNPLRRRDHPLEGGLFFFRGLVFLLWLSPVPPPEDIPFSKFVGPITGEVTLIRHLRRICDGPKHAPSQILKIQWD